MIECFNDRRLKIFPCEPLKRDLLRLRAIEKSYGFKLESPRDSEGHGGSYSAFALALVIAHELTGKRPVRAGVWSDEGDATTPFEREMRAIEERQAQYQREREWLNKPNDDQEEWREIARLSGRT